jgi:MinD-like ATPase involved in chromosome partitioning or flagellar assembly
VTLRLLTAGGPGAEPALVARIERAGAGVSVARRCVDLADLLASAATDGVDAALVWPDLRRLDRDAVARLRSCGVAVLGVVDGDPSARSRLCGIGVADLVEPEVDVDELVRVVRTAVETAALPASSAVRERGAAAAPADARDAAPPGRLVAVWGPTGAPGRTTLAVTLADELARLEHPTLLADADVYGGTVAPLLGLLDESPGLAAAARLANAGALDLTGLARLAPALRLHLRVLTGIARADRWPELRPSALEVVWDLARSLARTTVADCAFALEDETGPDAGRRRNGATLLTLEQADLVLAVGSGDPLGVARLARGVETLRAAVPTAEVRVVLNKVRRGPVGPAPERQLVEALRRHADADVVALLPYDIDGCDAMLRHGRSLAEVAPRSPLRAAVAELAGLLAGRPAVRRGRRR